MSFYNLVDAKIVAPNCLPNLPNGTLEYEFFHNILRILERAGICSSATCQCFESMARNITLNGFIHWSRLNIGATCYTNAVVTMVNMLINACNNTNITITAGDIAQLNVTARQILSHRQNMLQRHGGGNTGHQVAYNLWVNASQRLGQILTNMTTTTTTTTIPIDEL